MSFSAVALLASSFLTVAYAQTASLSPAAAASQASGISQVLNPGFAGFGIEPSNLFSFTGGSTQNDLSVNLLQNLVNYAGAPPHIRIGGNTADNMVYDASYSQWQLQYNPHANGQGNVPSNQLTFGPTFWQALDRFPSGLPVTFGLNLAYDFADYIENIVTEATSAVKTLKNVELYSFEIGNEPDLYLQNTFRNGTWNGQVYTQQWLDRAQAVYTQVLEPNGLPSNFFEPAATASTIGTTFAINDLVQYQINADDNGTAHGYVSSWNQHDYFYFVGVSSYTLTLDYLLDFDNTNSQFQYWTTQVSAALQTGMAYNLREMASAGPIGVEGISDTFGAALWQLNFFLYAASLNITSVGMHMTDNSYAAAWAPIEKYNQAPHVRPSYYAWPAIDQLIGTSNGTLQVAPLTLNNIPSGYNGFIRGYAQYSKGNLSSVTIINGQVANSSDTSKNSVTVTVSFPSSAAGQTVYLSYLNAAGADATSNITWNSLSFEANGDGTPSDSSDGLPATASIASDGTASLSIRDSQALVANLGVKLGSTAVDLPGPSQGKGQPKKSAASTSKRATPAFWFGTCAVLFIAAFAAST